MKKAHHSLNGFFTGSGYASVSASCLFFGIVCFMFDDEDFELFSVSCENALLRDVVFEVGRWLLSSGFVWGWRVTDSLIDAVMFTVGVDEVDTVVVFDEGGRLFCGVLDEEGDVFGSAIFGGQDCGWSAALWVGSVLYSYA